MQKFQSDLNPHLRPEQIEAYSDIKFTKKRIETINDQTQNFRELNQKIFKDLLQSQKILLQTLGAYKIEDRSKEYTKDYKKRWDQIKKDLKRKKLKQKEIINFSKNQIFLIKNLYKKIEKNENNEKNLNSFLRKLISKLKTLDREENKNRESEEKSRNKLMKLVLAREKERRQRDCQVVDESGLKLTGFSFNMSKSFNGDENLGTRREKRSFRVSKSMIRLKSKKNLK